MSSYILLQLYSFLNKFIFMLDLFSKEKVNVGRQVELDIAKVLAIIFMIFLHTLMVVKGFNYSLSPA